MVKKIGLLLGSFNPIHNGHLDMMKISIESGLIKEGYFIPAKQNPYKPCYGVNIRNRSEMICAAISSLDSEIGNKMFSLGTFEENLSGYTIDTLIGLKRVSPYKFVIICGEDVYYQIITWKEGKNILDNYEFILFDRDEPIISYDENIIGKFQLPKESKHISSSNIRTDIATSSSFWHQQVPVQVEDLILKNKYYKT